MGLALSLAPVYLLPSGLPQVGDLLLAVYVVFVATRVAIYGGRLREKRFLWIWAGLVTWITVVSSIWVVVHSDVQMARPIAYYAFNFFVGMALLIEIEGRPNVLRVIRAGLCCGLVLSFVGVAINFGSTPRAMGFFNNPNQLAYYSLASLASILVIDRGRVSVDTLTLSAYIGALSGVVAAASIAAMLGTALLIGIVGFMQLRRGKSFVRLVVAGALAASAFTVIDVWKEGLLREGLIARYERSGEKVDAAYEERGFDRLVENPSYLLLGAGEGGLDRFASAGGREVGELHSSLLTLLFSYGVVGLGIFLLLLRHALRGASWPLWVITASVMVYQLTHMGLRFTSFWIFLVLVCVASAAQRRSRGDSRQTNEPWVSGSLSP